MSNVGKFLFSKLVLPAIAVQAKETDIEAHNHQHVHTTTSVPTEKLGIGTQGTGHSAAPAYRSPTTRSHHLTYHNSSDDPLLQELIAFRMWQQQQGHDSNRRVMSPHASKTVMSPVRDIDLSRQRASISGMNATSPHSPNIIVIAGNNHHLEPSNLSVTNEPSVQPVTDVAATSPHHPRRPSIETGHSLMPIGEEKPEDALADPSKSYEPHVSLRIDDQVHKSPHGIVQQHITTEQTSIVQTVDTDGKVIDKFVTTNIKYSNNELYVAATQFYHRLLAELLGTFAIVFYIGGLGIESSLGHITQMGVAIGAGLIFVALIYSLGQVSGAHFNPVVTFAFVLRGMFPLTWLPFYWFVQFVGALLAAGMLLGFYTEEQGKAGATIANIRSEEACFLMETVLTFVLVFTILSMASRSKIVGPHAALAIGSVIALDIMLAGSYSGASMNPFRSISIAIVFPITFYSTWVYFAGPFLGSFIAVVAVFLLAGRPRDDELTAGIGASIAVAISNQLSRNVTEDETNDTAK